MGESKHWVARYNKMNIDISETHDCHIFVSAASIRKVLLKLPNDQALQKTHGRGVGAITKSGPLFFNETAFRRELKLLGSAEAHMFGEWMHHNVFYPAAKKRGEEFAPNQFSVAGSQLAQPVRISPPVDRANSQRVHFIQWALIPITAHWQGDVGLRKTLIESALAACLMAWLVNKGFHYLGNPDNYNGNWEVLQITTLFLTLALLGIWIWWGVGATRSALNHVKVGKSIASALCVYMLGLLFMIHSLASALDDGRDWLRSIYSDNEIAKIRFDPEFRRIIFTGHVGFGTYRNLRRVMQDHPDAEFLELNSPGGYVLEGLALARLVTKSNLTTVTFRYCDSACTLIFAAGTKRLLGTNAIMGFHRSYVFGKPILDRWSSTENYMAKYLEDRGVMWQFIQTAFSYGGDQLWEPTHREMIESGFATGRWAHRGLYYGSL